MAIQRGAEHTDGTRSLDFQLDDGGRAAAGFKGGAGDCVCRSVAIAAGLPYEVVYRALASGTGQQRASRGRKRAASAREGINTNRKWFRDWMAAQGFVWTPTMAVGTGCRVHLLAGEVPMSGRHILRVSRHYVALVDGVLHDTSDPSRATVWLEHGRPPRLSHRCVYGYWTLAAALASGEQ